MTTTKQNINDMIYKTLRTKGDKTAKFADKLRELGYEVTNWGTSYNGERFEREYWCVNGLEVDKYQGETAMLGLGRGQYVEKFDAIKRIDFVDYFEKLESRKAKWERYTAHDNIKQERFSDKRYFWTSRRYVKVGFTRDTNYEVEQYKRLKAASKGGSLWGGNGFCDHMRYRMEDVERAERKLAEAQAELERAKEALAKAQAEVQERGGELHEFLTKRGIRKEVA